MTHSLKVIARNFQLDEPKFFKFAQHHIGKFGVQYDNGILTTTTWHTNSLVKAFQHHDGLHTMYTSDIQDEDESAFMKLVLKRALNQLDNYFDPKKIEARVVELEKLWRKSL